MDLIMFSKKTIIVVHFRSNWILMILCNDKMEHFSVQLEAISEYIHHWQRLNLNLLHKNNLFILYTYIHVIKDIVCIKATLEMFHIWKQRSAILSRWANVLHFPLFLQMALRYSLFPWKILFIFNKNIFIINIVNFKIYIDYGWSIYAWFCFSVSID